MQSAEILSEWVERTLGVEVRSAARVGGGDVAESFRLALDDGRPVFAKTHRSPPPGFFTTEAWGLWWLRSVEAVPVPQVLAVTDGRSAGPATHDSSTPDSGAIGDPLPLVDGPIPALLLEWIDEGSARADTEAEFGRALATLHRAGAPCFGREDRRTTGSRGLPNDPCDTWAEFYAERRLLPLARLARDGGALPEPTIERLESVAGRLDELGGPIEPAARLHGDLWAGNRLVDRQGRSWLIDPAAHGGHREFDLAMMRLFGGFGAACFAAYSEEFPLADGWQDRVALHQLAPLTVHAIKFGGGYVGATARALDTLR